jgi:hypothetical protein
MDGPPVQEAAQRLEELIRAVDDLRCRVAALEQGSTAAAPGVQLALPAAEPEPIPEVSSGLLAQLGRLLLGIAGAYLLRAITEAGILPELTGILVGLLYAGGWLVASIRTAASNRVALSLEGLTASAIAAPLLWEATARFHAIAPSGAAGALAFFIVLGQAVAWRHDHSAIAAITALAGSLTAIALIIATLDPVPFAVALLVAAAVAEYGAIRGHALAWRWIIALAADLCSFLLVYLVTRPGGLPPGYAPVPIRAVMAVQLTLVAVYLASTAVRTLIRRCRIAWFEILQVAAVVVFAIVSNLRHEVGGWMIAAGAVCYLAALGNAAPRLSRNFHAYATFGVSLVIAGGLLLFHGLTIVALWSVLAMGAIWFGGRYVENTLSMHGAVYLLAEAAASFKLGQQWPTVVVAPVAYGLMLWIGSGQKQSVMQRIPATVAAGAFVWSIYGIAARIEGTFADPFRTALISAIALTLGWAGRRWDRKELIWVLYPWMTFGAAKLFVEDFQKGRAATLFLSLLVYGGTLIVLPRLLRRTVSRCGDLS